MKNKRELRLLITSIFCIILGVWQACEGDYLIAYIDLFMGLIIMLVKDIIGAIEDNKENK